MVFCWMRVFGRIVVESSTTTTIITPMQPAFAPSFVVGEALAPMAVSFNCKLAFGASSFTTNNTVVVACTVPAELTAPFASVAFIVAIAYMGSLIACSSIITVIVAEAPLLTAIAQKVIWLHLHPQVCS